MEAPHLLSSSSCRVQWFGFVLCILLPVSPQELLTSGHTGPQVELWHLRVPAAPACAEQMKDYSDQFGEKGDFSPSVHPQGSISS